MYNAQYRHELAFSLKLSRPRVGAHYATLMMVRIKIWVNPEI